MKVGGFNQELAILSGQVRELRRRSVGPSLYERGVRKAYDHAELLRCLRLLRKTASPESLAVYEAAIKRARCL